MKRTVTLLLLCVVALGVSAQYYRGHAPRTRVVVPAPRAPRADIRGINPFD